MMTAFPGKFVQRFMFYLCKCPQDCGDGYIDFWRCSDSKSIILRCDECEAPWLNPADVTAAEPMQMSAPNYLLPKTNVPVYGGCSGWATQHEIEMAGWSSFLQGESKALNEKLSGSGLCRRWIVPVKTKIYQTNPFLFRVRSYQSATCKRLPPHWQKSNPFFTLPHNFALRHEFRLIPDNSS